MSWKDNLKSSLGMSTIHADFYDTCGYYLTYIYRNGKLFATDNKRTDEMAMLYGYQTVLKSTSEKYKCLKVTVESFYDFLDHWNEKYNILVNGEEYGDKK